MKNIINPHQIKVWSILTPRQKEAMQLLLSDTFYTDLYGGSRSGKTMVILISRMLMSLYKTSRHLVVRKYLSDLTKSVWHETLPKAFDLMEIPRAAYKLNQNLHIVKFTNGSEIWFGGMENQKVQDKILGKEYTTAWVNEASDFDPEVIPNILSRLAENSGFRLKMTFDFNPPKTSHWTHELVIDGKLNDAPVEIKSLHMNPEHNVQNLNPNYIKVLESMPERQKKRFLLGLFVTPDDALFTEDMIRPVDKLPEYFTKTVIGVDPAVTDNKRSDMTGIFTAASFLKDYFKLADNTCKASPTDWAHKALDEYFKWSKISRETLIAAEVNQGGDLVREALNKAAENRCCHCPAIRYRQQNNSYLIKRAEEKCNHFWGVKFKYKALHTSMSKELRAEAYSAFLATQNVQTYSGADFKAYINQLTGYEDVIANNKSPDRVDAAIIAFTEIKNFGKTLYFAV